jgi:hypothetical protein
MPVIIKIRRGTTTQWSSSTRVLQSGELGLDTTLNKFKVGNGTSSWSSLPFLNVLPSELAELSQDAVADALLNFISLDGNIQVTYDDEGNAIGLDVGPNVVLSNNLDNRLGDYVPIGDVGNPDGIATLDSDGLIPDSQIPSTIARDSEMPTDTDDISEGSSRLYFTDERARTALSADTNGTSGGLRIIAPDTGDVTITGHEATHSITIQSDGIDGVTNSKVIIKGSTEVTASSSIADPGNLNVAGQITAGTLNVTGNLTVGGTTTTVNAQDLVITDPLIYIGEDNSSNAVDLGLVASFNDGTYQHTGLVKDATDGKWKLFKGVVDEPTTTLNFSQATFDELQVGPLEATNITITGTVTGIDKSDVGLSNVDNTSDETKYKNEYVSSSATSLTLSSTTHKFKVIEFTSGSAITVTIPNDTQDSGWPVGSYVEVRQTGNGQITVAKDAAVTYNAPEDQYKSRVKWSSLFIEKRSANTWLITGDATA